MFRSRDFRVLVVLFSGTMFLGLTSCADNAARPSRLPLEGKITTPSGKTINGSISLTPASGTNGVAATASIVDGMYRFTTADGPQAGKYQATIIVNRVPDAVRKEAPAQTIQVRDTFDADLSSSPPRLDHTLKTE